MSWTAKILELRPMNGGGVEVVTYVTQPDGKQYQQCFQTDGTLASLTAAGRAIASSKDQASAKSDLSLGLVVDLTPVVPVADTPADPAIAQFLSDVAAMRREERAQASKLVTGADLTALRNKVQAGITGTPALAGLL